MNTIHKHFGFLMVIAILLLAGCSSSSSNSSPSVPQGYTLANGTVLTIPINHLNVAAGNSTSTVLIANGGSAGIKILLTAQTSNKTTLQAATIMPIVAFNPESLITGSTTGSSINVSANTNVAPGNYVVQINVAYIYNQKSYFESIGAINLMVESDTISQPGTLSLIPEVVNLTNESSTNLVLALNNSMNVDNLQVKLASDSTHIILNTDTCNLSTTINTCTLTITGNNTSSNISTITTSSTGYESTNAQINFQVINAWVWMGGESDENFNGANYGIKGVESAGNIPGGRALSATWKDSAGNFWMFGGEDSYGNVYNDLWRYNITTHQWAWISGESTTNGAGNYGTQGTSSLASLPPSRSSIASAIDSSGNMWLFGGKDLGGSNYYNDLWKYNPNTNMWTWVSGANTSNNLGVYGTKGTPGNANIPGARYSQVATADINGNLWIFGGSGYSSTGTADALNDLWKYNIDTNLWTWMSGDDTSNPLGSYGTKGVASSSNTPNGKPFTVGFNDGAGNFWIFGGGNQNLYFTNDLWKYSFSTNQWTWMSGESTLNSSGSYGNQGIANVSYAPSSRYAGNGWVDNSGNLWILGGLNYNNGATPIRTNDLWKYNITNNTWTWVTGQWAISSGGICGTQYIASTTNNIGATALGLAWADNSGNLWAFGGYSYDCQQPPNSGFFANLLWKYRLY